MSVIIPAGPFSLQEIGQFFYYMIIELERINRDSMVVQGPPGGAPVIVENRKRPHIEIIDVDLIEDVDLIDDQVEVVNEMKEVEVPMVVENANNFNHEIIDLVQDEEEVENPGHLGVDGGGNLVYEVEKIIAKRKVKGRRQFLVWWKNYPRECASWVYQEQLDYCQESVYDYLNRRVRRRRV